MSERDARTQTLQLVVPLELTVRVGEARAPAATAAERAGLESLSPGLERGKIDTDYSDREGYDERFVGPRVPLPTLSPKGMRRVSRRVDVDRDDNHLLPYHHYTAVMNRARRFCFFTAANTTRDPELLGSKRREDMVDTWIFDARIPESHQVGHKEFYGPAIFDKGHVHRREDGYWGRDEAEQDGGNNDTFHFTNSTPQHPRFNQSSKRGEWGELENHVAEQLGSQRFSIFAGPVFRADDPEVEGVQVPLSFWKIVIAKRGPRGGGALGAWAFHLDQSHLPVESALERFDPGRFVRRQVSVKEIERLTDVRFDDVVHDADVLGDGAAPVEIESLRDVRGLR